MHGVQVCECLPACVTLQVMRAIFVNKSRSKPRIETPKSASVHCFMQIVLAASCAADVVTTTALVQTHYLCFLLGKELKKDSLIPYFNLVCIFPLLLCLALFLVSTITSLTSSLYLLSRQRILIYFHDCWANNFRVKHLVSLW